MRSTGGGRRDYAGISSVKECVKHSRRKPKVSWGRLIRPGLVGPKARLKGVVDGKRANNPVPPVRRLTEGVTQGDRHSRVMEVLVQASEECTEGNPGAGT